MNGIDSFRSLQQMLMNRAYYEALFWFVPKGHVLTPKI